MRFRIASFNVENLLGPGIRFYDRLSYTPEETDAKANWMASILNRAKADIVGIQEVWFEDTLKEAVGRSSEYAQGVNVAAPGATIADNMNGKVAKRPRLGIVSRFPIKSVEVFQTFPSTIDLTIPLRVDGGKILPVTVGINQFQRAPLRAVIDIAGMDLVVYVAHLKSKGPMIAPGENGDDPLVGALGQARATIVRAAEAAALRHLIVADLRDNQRPTILLGDLNDTPEAASTQTVRGPAPHPGMPYDEKRTIWDVILYSTYRIAAERSSTIHTHIHDGERDILDHILVSEEFFTRNRGRIGTVVRHDVINDHLRDNEHHPRTPGSADHGVPIAEIELLGPA